MTFFRNTVPYCFSLKICSNFSLKIDNVTPGLDQMGPKIWNGTRFNVFGSTSLQITVLKWFSQVEKEAVDILEGFDSIYKTSGGEAVLEVTTSR